MPAVLVQYAAEQVVGISNLGVNQHYDELCSVIDYLGRKCVLGRRGVYWYVLSSDEVFNNYLIASLNPEVVVRVAINNAVKAVRDGTTRRLDCCLLAYFGAVLIGNTRHADSILRSIASSEAQKWTKYVLQIGVIRSPERIDILSITNAMVWLEKDSPSTKDEDLKHLATHSSGDVEFLLPLADYLEDICDPVASWIRVLSSAMLSQVRASV